jgi:hypothetical protein
MKDLLVLTFLLFYSFNTFAQNQAYYVKQTQVSYDMERFEALVDNPIFTKIVFKENGIEFNMPNSKFTFIEFSKIDKVDLTENSFRYEVEFSDGLKAALFFTPFPYTYSDPKFIMSIIQMPGLVKSDPSIITFFRLVFVDNLIIK